MAITAPGMAPGGGTEPGLHAVWRLVSVDPSADQFGISALSRGQPCGRQILPLLVEIDRLACRCVVDCRGFAPVTRRSGRLERAHAKRHAIHRGKARAILGVARSFWIRARPITKSRWAPERTGDWSSGRPSKEIARTR